MLDQITAALRPLGFVYITLDTQGYRSGSMNDVLPVSAIASAEPQPANLPSQRTEPARETS